MTINNTLFNSNHLGSHLDSLKSSVGLPFKELLSSEDFNTSIKGHNYRKRIFSPDITLWALLSQVLDDDQSLQAAVARVIAFFVSKGHVPPSINTSAYCQARTRLPEEVLSQLVRKNAEELEEKVPANWCWRNKTIKLMDGTTISMPDTERNQAIYPQSSSQKPGIGFPLARVVSIISYTTGAILDAGIGPYAGKGSGEHTILRRIIDSFNAGDIAIGDKYYPSFFLMATLKKMGVDGVFPMHFGRQCDFRKGRRLGTRDHIVYWKKPRKKDWMTDEEYNEFPDEIEIREVLIQNYAKGFRTQRRIIITTFLGSKSITGEDLLELYHYRWSIELDLRSIKETMHMGILRGITPEMVRKEIWAHFLAYNLIRKIMAQAAMIHNKKPRNLSFKLALQVLRAFRQAGILQDNQEQYYVELLKAIAYKTIGNRPGRWEPRRVKRRPKPYALLSSFIP